MRKDELEKLLLLKDLPANEAQKREPQLWAAILAEQTEKLRAHILDALKTSAPEVREHVAALNFSGVAPADVARHVSESLEKAGLKPDVLEEALSKIESVRPREGLSPEEEEDRPLAQIPEVALKIEKARLIEIAGIAKLDDATAGAVAAAVEGPGVLGDSALRKLVEDGKLSKERAVELGFAAALYGIADENAQLAVAARNAKLPHMEGRAPSSTKDLATLRAADWETILAEADVALPEGVTRESASAVLADRFAFLHPDLAFTGRLPKITQSAATAAIKSLEPLFAKNPKVVGSALEKLNTEGLSPNQVKQLEVAHAQLRALVRAYPGLRLDEVLDDPQQTPEAKAAMVERRISLIDNVHKKLGEGELLALDYTPESPDLVQLDLAKLGVSAEEQSLVISTLKTYQRSYALTRHVDNAQHLIERGFTSAKDIATRSFQDFQAATTFDQNRARRYWASARKTFLDSTLTLGSVVDLWAGLFNELAVGNLRPSVRDYLRQLDGFQTLFGSLSFCTCAHCQSILGPAAYFVDLMKFVEDHLRPQFGSRTNHPLDLKTRRPDLWTLDLTCACKDERIPTLDVVNEVLENYIARTRGFTGLLTDRVSVSRIVYEQQLLAAVNSFVQPFHLPLARIDAYLAKMETSRSDVARVLGVRETVAAAAALTLSPQQWQRITHRETDLGQLGQSYGMTFSSSGGGVAAVDAQQLLVRTGLSRDELGQLVATAFVAAGGASVTIRVERRGAESVQNDIEKVYGLTADALDRMHRFARLSKKLPWSIAELDRALTALGDSTLGEPALMAIARVREVQTRLGTSLDETCALFGELPRQPTDASLFDRLFNPPSIVAVNGTFPKDTERFIHPAFRTSPPTEANPAVPRLLAGLRVDLDGLGRLARYLAPHLRSSTGVGFDPAARNEADRHFTLSTANLTLLYRHARLAQALGLSVDELFQLVSFASLPGRVRNLNDLVQLLSLHAWWRKSGYRLDDLAVAIGATPSDATRYANPETLAREIVSGASDALSFNDTIFALALGTSEEASRELRTANSRLFEAAGAGRWRLADGLNLSRAAITIPATATVPTPPSGSRLVGGGEIRATLAAYLPSEALLRRLAAVFNLDLAKARALVAIAGRDLTARELTIAFRGEGALTPVRDLVAAMRPYVVAFQATEWNASALDLVRHRPGLFDLTTSGLTVASLRAITVYTRLATRQAGAPSNASPVAATDVLAALEAFDSATSTLTSAVAAPLARLLSVSPGLVLGLRGHVSTTGPAALALDALAQACLLAQSLGIDAETLRAIVGDNYAALARAADSLLAAYGTRFGDETQRQKQLSVLEEPLRERKRDALVAYLIYSLSPPAAVRPEERFFNSAEELYAYFLIDVQSGGCATTSCIATAISSVQLYVHRVSMNLEQDRRVPSDSQHVRLRMPEEAAAEWTWRKNYRVWEANRKVFLWPENYIEPDLRDDKTPLFKELESELLQTDLTDLNVLDAYTKYLKGFEEVAALTIAGAYQDVRADGDHTADVLHLFGVSASDPPAYYYRTCENLVASGRDPQLAATWSPWQNINVQITGRRVSPIVFQGRLHLFWADYQTRPINEFRNGNSEFTGYRHTMSVRFTTLRPDGAWTAPQAVELPNADWFGPGRGAIPDPLRGRTPRLADREHREPLDDYTLEGPNWDWLWLEPVSSGRETILGVGFRNFLESGSVDLFDRRINLGISPVPFGIRPQLLCARGNSLYYGSPGSWVWGHSGVANAVIDERRLEIIGRELTGVAEQLRFGLYTEQVATLRPGTQLLAVPGSVEDAIAQVGRDLLLFQGSVTDDNRYVVRRIGTTLAGEVSRHLFVGGVAGLLALETQYVLREESLPLTPANNLILDRTNRNRLDFNGPYGVYYREIFFHIPFLIANALNSRGRFAAAQRWYHYVFDPTSTEEIVIIADLPPEERARRLLDRVWRYRAFRNLDAPRLREILTDEQALAVYRKDPFNPHAIARVRVSAYQKAVVMKYVDNLLDWADHLFTQFTNESVNEALMLYVMASDILGPRPVRLGDCGEGAVRPKTYQNIAPTLGPGEEILAELESWSIGKRASEKRAAKVSGESFGLDQSLIAHARERFELQPTTSVTKVGGVTSQASLSTGGSAEAISADGSGEQSLAATASTTGAAAADAGASDEPMFRGLDWKMARTGGWGPQLGASATLGDGLSISPTQEHFGRFAVADWVGSFGWSILRQVGPAFCIPVNQDLLAYWDRVEDRLYKIRHCMDITGQRRELALFAPEIDPRLLVRMRAAGLTLEDVLGTTTGSLPPYRFLYLVERAKAFAASLSGFGAALLSAIEKKDAEEMSRLRLVQQQNLARLTTRLRSWDIEVARESQEALEKQKAAAEYRRGFYQDLLNEERDKWEIAQSVARHTASAIYTTEALLQFLAGVGALLPQVGAPTAMKYGGVELKGSLSSFANSINAVAKVAEAVAASTGLEAGFARRREGWEHQKDLAARDIQMLDKQIEAARIRVQIAERSLALHEKSIEQMDEILELTDGKFTNLGRYTWLSTRLRRLYRDAYQNAMALARLAEQAFRFERGDETSPGLSASPWDSLHAGLLAGEQLLTDLQNLERRFLETNYRSLEIDQAFALSQVSPEALVQLRETGECRFTITSLFFDLYYPGHYKRRIKGVRLTIPSITGPYVNVSATLTLERSWIRPTPAPGQAQVEMPPRRSVSVATSTAQNDAGVFELSFRDERYMPFEGAGAISAWHLELPKTFRQFDYQTITEVILSISYTAEQDSGLRSRVEADNATVADSALDYLKRNSVARLFSLRQDFSGAFTRLLHASLGTSLSIVIDDRHFPAFLRGRPLRVERALVLLRTWNAAVPTGFQLTIDGATARTFTKAGQPGELPGQDLPSAFRSNLRGTHTLSVAAAGNLAPAARTPDDPSTIDPEKLLDILLYVEFRLV
jgi:hypothetical protein